MPALRALRGALLRWSVWAICLMRGFIGGVVLFFIRTSWTLGIVPIIGVTSPGSVGWANSALISGVGDE